MKIYLAEFTVESNWYMSDDQPKEEKGCRLVMAESLEDAKRKVKERMGNDDLYGYHRRVTDVEVTEPIE